MALGFGVESESIFIGDGDKKVELPPDYQSPQVLSACVRSELADLKRKPVYIDAGLVKELQDKGVYTPRGVPLHRRLPVNIFDPRVAITLTAVFLATNR